MQRVFIGIPVNKPVQQQIDELLKPIKESLKGVRWVPEHNRHLTLAFLGNKTNRVIENLLQSMDQAYRQETVFQTGFSGLRRFPGSTGNIIALVFDADTHLDHLFQVTQAFLVENGICISRQQFLPHITLGRIRRALPLNSIPNQQTNIHLQINKITFFQSTLTKTGSNYLALKETGLKRRSATGVTDPITGNGMNA